MDNQENHETYPILKPSSRNNPILCSLSFNPIEPLKSLGGDLFEIEIFLFFRHWHEIHYHCKNPKSASEEDHNILWKEPGKPYRARFVIKPSNPDQMLEHCIAEGLRSYKKDFPSYASRRPGVMRYMEAKIVQYLRDHLNFNENLLGLRLDIDVTVDVSTVDLGHDNDSLSKKVN